MDRKKIIFGIVLAVVVVLIIAIAWFILNKDRSEPLADNQEVERVLKKIEVTQEMLDSITPPPDAVPTEITQEMLDSITPPPDAVPTEITQEMLDSITPPGAKPVDAAMFKK